MISGAVGAFDGLIGWLTCFGYNYVRGVKSISPVLERATNLALTEPRRFLQTR